MCEWAATDPHKYGSTTGHDEQRVLHPPPDPPIRGKDEKGERKQVLELPDHPFFVGPEALPESSLPTRPRTHHRSAPAELRNEITVEEVVVNGAARDFFVPHEK
ncbi:hypothetical protein BDZ94DRAFT_1234802 [Collybia nuda]|uniref:Uncharacterized protein n=1 Tax=Collybia nuda TaxID=64659 RepID=A0A9P5YC30_9AGAR|nr:hypothetical protein BDZ94DRAFT_1234802 [Collybia nuda]